MDKRKFNPSHGFILIMLIIVLGMVYINTVFNQFVWDDFHFIVGWERLHNFGKFWPEILKGDIPVGSASVYRPIRSLFYAISYRLYGLNPIGYKLQAMGMHILASILVYAIGYELFGKKWVAALTALVFGLHPMQVEAVAWTTASFDTIGNLFFLLAVYGFIRSKKNNYQWKKTSIIATGMAYFTSELTLVLPLVLIIYDFLMGKMRKINIKKLWGEHKPYWLLNLGYWILRWGLLPKNQVARYMFDNPIKHGLIMVAGLKKYLLLMLWPNKLDINQIIVGRVRAFFNHDYYQGLAGFEPSMFDKQILIAVTGLGFLVGGWLITKKKKGFFWFGAWWLLICLLPAMQIFPQKIVFSERHAYLAIAGMAWMVGGLVLTIGERVKKSWIKVGLAVVVMSQLIWYGYMTGQRKKVWENSVTFWETALKTSPDSYYVLVNLGGAYYVERDFIKATEMFEKAIEMNPTNINDRTKLGLIYFQMGDYQQVIANMNKVIKEDKDNILAYSLMADAFLALGNETEASKYYQLVLLINKKDGHAAKQLLRIQTDNPKSGVRLN